MTEERRANIDRDLHREREAARDLLAQLKAVGADEDEDLVADSLEGETDLHEALAAVLDAIDQDEAMIAGIKTVEARFARRRQAAAARVERRKAMIEQTMMMLDQTTVRLPAATLSLRTCGPSLIVSDESVLPSRFFNQPPPKLDRKALTQALRDGAADINGASLDNGGVALAIRRT